MSSNTVRLPKFIEIFIQILIIYSIGTYFLELEWAKSENSLVGSKFWLWSERVVAVIFTIEYLIRWRISQSWYYPFTFVAIVDLASVIPFYIGFFVNTSSLRLIRTLRVLRLLKFYKYSKSVQRIIHAFYNAGPDLLSIGFVVFVFMFYSSTFIYESERISQPDKFSSIFDAMWWSLVSMTTVGYGDLYPTTVIGRFIAALTIVFGIAIFSAFFSVIQEKMAEETDISNKELLNKIEILIRNNNDKI